MENPINQEIIKEALQKHYKDPQLEIINCTSKLALEKGENYASSVWRLCIQWQRGNKIGEEKLIIKCLPEGEWIKSMVVDLKYFENESAHYKTLVPIYKNIYQKRTGKILPEIGAGCYPTEKDHFLILEDLGCRGFQMADRREGGDFDQALLVMKALAKLHGLSIAAYRENPVPFDEISKSNFYKENNRTTLINIFEIPMKELLTNEIKKWPKFERFVGRIKPLSAENLSNYALKTGKLRVMLHGDCWITNMLFRYEKDKRKPLEVFLLDFQLTHWGPIAFDLIYFMYTSLSAEILEQNKDQLISEYILELHKWLGVLGEDIGEYTKENIISDIKEEQLLGLIIVCTFLNFMLCDPEDSPSMNDLEDTSKNDVNKTRNNPRFQERLLKHFYLFEKEGII